MNNKYISYENEIKESINKFSILIEDFKKSKINKVIEMAYAIVESIKKGKMVYCCGNGGSAADSQHIAGEFIGRFIMDRKALPFISLNTDTSVLTCIGNDFGFDYIFSRQIEALGRSNDVLIVFSTSGSSRNIILAAETAKKMGLKILSFTGKKNTQIEKISDLCFCAEAEETYLAQQIHQLAYHLICKIVEEKLFLANSRDS